MHITIIRPYDLGLNRYDDRKSSAPPIFRTTSPSEIILKRKGSNNIFSIDINNIAIHVNNSNFTQNGTKQLYIISKLLTTSDASHTHFGICLL